MSAVHSNWSARFISVEGDPGAISNQDGYQDALSKKQRRPQEEERRRKEQGPSVCTHKLGPDVPDLLKTQSVAFAYKRLIVSLLRYKWRTETLHRRFLLALPKSRAAWASNSQRKHFQPTTWELRFGKPTAQVLLIDSFTSCPFFLFCFEYLSLSRIVKNMLQSYLNFYIYSAHERDFIIFSVF